MELSDECKRCDFFNGCLIVYYQANIIEDCPCQLCIVKSMCAEICNDRLNYSKF